MGTTPIYGFPYPDPSDLVANYPAMGQELAEDVESVISGLGAGLDLITEQTIAGGTSTVTVSNCFTATYRNYRVILSNFVGTTNIDIRLALDGLTTNYNWAHIIGNTSGTISGAAASGASRWIVSTADSATGNACSFDVHGPQLAQRTTFAGTGFVGNTTRSVGGQQTDNTAATGFTITSNTGTFGGYLAVYGYRN